MFENEKEGFLYSISTKVEQTYPRKTLVKLFFIGFFGNVLSWLIAFFTPDFIGSFVSTFIDIKGKVLVYLLIIPFSFAFLMAFSIFKAREKQAQNLPDQEKDFLDSYFDNQRAADYRIIFLISAMIGGLNALILAFAVISFR